MSVETIESPLKHLLRKEEIPFFSTEDMARKMKKVHLLENLKEGPVQFVLALFNCSNKKNLGRVHVYSVLILPTVLLSVCYLLVASFTQVLVTAAIVDIVLTVLVLYLAFAALLLTPIESIINRCWHRYHIWEPEPLHDHVLPIPVVVLDLATEIKMRLPQVEFEVITHRSIKVKENYTSVKHIGKDHGVQIMIKPPDPFLMVRLNNERYVIAYWDKSTWDSTVTLPE